MLRHLCAPPCSSDLLFVHITSWIYSHRSWSSHFFGHPLQLKRSRYIHSCHSRHLFIFLPVALTLNSLSRGFMSSQQSGGRVKWCGTAGETSRLHIKGFSIWNGSWGISRHKKKWNTLCFSPLLCQSRTWKRRAACGTYCVCVCELVLCSDRRHWRDAKQSEANNGCNHKRRNKEQQLNMLDVWSSKHHQPCQFHTEPSRASRMDGETPAMCDHTAPTDPPPSPLNEQALMTDMCNYSMNVCESHQYSSSFSRQWSWGQFTLITTTATTQTEEAADACFYQSHVSMFCWYSL